MKNGSRTLELDTVRYCAFADPGQVKKTTGLFHLPRISKSRRPQNSFATPAPTIPAVQVAENRFLDGYWKNILARDRGCRGVHTSHCLNIAVAVTKVECTFFDESWS